MDLKLHSFLLFLCHCGHCLAALFLGSCRSKWSLWTRAWVSPRSFFFRHSGPTPNLLNQNWHFHRSSEMHLHIEVWKASILPKSLTCSVDTLVRTACDPQECTPGELSWCPDRREDGCVALCYELNLVSAQCQRGPQRHKPTKGIAELPGAWSLAGTQSLVL